jgi:uncharacterized cysteine cluster protein YcgN (CxxCxxCC family)
MSRLLHQIQTNTQTGLREFYCVNLGCTQFANITAVCTNFKSRKETRTRNVQLKVEAQKCYKILLDKN